MSRLWVRDKSGKLKFLLVSIFLLFFQFTWLQHWTHSISWSPSHSARSTFYDIQFILKCLTWLFGGVWIAFVVVHRSAWHVECPLKRRQTKKMKKKKLTILHCPDNLQVPNWFGLWQHIQLFDDHRRHTARVICWCGIYCFQHFALVWWVDGVGVDRWSVTITE